MEQRYQRPSDRQRRSRAKAIPHSHRHTPSYPDPGSGRTWPPRGWSEVGIRNHEIESARSRAFLCTWGAAGGAPHGDYERIDPAEARLRELAQFGRNPTAAAAMLQEATTSVLDLRGFTRADTHPIPTTRPRHRGLYQPGQPRPEQPRPEFRRSGAAS